MTFWNLPKLEPTRKFRFQIQTPGSIEKSFWIHAKTIDKPTYEMNVGEYQIGNQKLKYPGIVTWNDITITAVDTGGKTNGLYDNLSKMGWNVPGSKNAIKKIEKPGKTFYKILILQLNAKGETIETWTLNNAFFKSVNFGSLSYSDDELVEIQITVGFDYATFQKQETGFFGQAADVFNPDANNN
tara:strand:+ start:3183 stop:3737 length:555 start_codon:yes stop_codon:yes gene_type:complete